MVVVVVVVWWIVDESPAISKTWAGRGGGRMVSTDETVCGGLVVPSSWPTSGFGASSMGESSSMLAAEFRYLRVAASGPAGIALMYCWSKNGSVWLRDRCWGLNDAVVGGATRVVGGGTNRLGAMPESGVKMGEAGLRGFGE